jgi:hypothetical protein
MTDSFPKRVAGKRGLRESHEPRLALSRFKRTVRTEPLPTSWDGTHGITAWGMDGNDRYGDCGAAATDHYNMAKAGSTSVEDTLGEPKYAGTVATYFAYGIAQGEPGPNPDEGVDNATWLGFLWKNGIIDGYAEVDLADVKAAAVEFNGVLVGCLLGDDAEANFEKGLPWDNPPAPDPNDGHDILFIGWDPSWSWYVTWGALQWVTPSWQAANPTDAWVILDADDPSVNWPALIAELTALHGTVPSVTPPAPVPTPAPTPTPVTSSGCWGAILRLFGR